MKSYQTSIGIQRTVRNAADSITYSGKPQGYVDFVTAPLSNKGNFVDPTGWNYSISKRKFLNGKLLRYYWPSMLIQEKVEGNHQRDIILPVRDQRDTVYNLALDRLNSRVRGNLDLSIALAEAGTTTKMIRSTLKVLSHARKLKPPGGYGSTRDVANGYLQFKYGWQPLLGDVFSAANESLRVVINKLAHISASARIPEERSYTLRYNSVDSVPDVPINREIKKGSFSGCKIGVSLEIPTSAFQLDRWMSLNPISITWELIPYSFVVDWFVDVGSYLRNFETACLYNTQFRGGYKSEMYRIELEDTQDMWMSPVVLGSRKYLFSDVKGNALVLEFTRSRLASYPFPRRPTFNVDLSSSRLFSAAALLRQLLPDKSPPQLPGRTRPGRIR